MDRPEREHPLVAARRDLRWHPVLLVDVTIVIVALPEMARGLNTSLPDLQWVLDLYAETSDHQRAAAQAAVSPVVRPVALDVWTSEEIEIPRQDLPLK